MLYILEGCDGSGKTTLAEFLSKVLDAEVIHCSQHTPNSDKFFRDIVEASKTRNIIADRFCYGQFVYQEEKDRPLATPYLVPALVALYHLETVLLGAGAKVIYVTAPTEVIKQRLAERNESLIAGLTVEEVQSRYNAIRGLSLLPWVEYHTGGELDV